MWAQYKLVLILKNFYRLDEAEGQRRLALSVAQETLREVDNSYRLIWKTLVMISSEQGRIKEAEEQYHKMLAVHEESEKLDHPNSLHPNGLSIRNTEP